MACYTEDGLQAAIAAVRNGVSFHQAPGIGEFHKLLIPQQIDSKVPSQRADTRLDTYARGLGGSVKYSQIRGVRQLYPPAQWLSTDSESALDPEVRTVPSFHQEKSMDTQRINGATSLLPFQAALMEEAPPEV